MKMKFGLPLIVFLSMAGALYMPIAIASQQVELSQNALRKLLGGDEAFAHLEAMDSEDSEDHEQVSDGEELGATTEEIEASVIKILVRTHEYDTDHPWNGPSQDSQTGTGFIIEGQRIMTNAHVVANAAYVQVQRSDKPKSFVATVEHVGHECDLAIIKVKDPAFFEGLAVLEFGGIPNKRERVETIGFPAGGDSVSITEGTVSRIEMSTYAHTGTELLSIQTNAAINPGNSGGPVLGDDGKVVGVAFQGVDELQNTGYMIPTPVIKHFLDDINKGGYRGFPELGVDFQELENETLRRRFNIDDSRSGILVTHIQPGSNAKGRLKVGDVVMAIDGVTIDNDMQFSFSEKVRIGFLHLIRNKHLDDVLTLKVLRKGKTQTIKVQLTHSSSEFDVIPAINFDKKPSFYIYGGCVFQPMTGDALAAGLSMDMLFTIDKEKHKLDQEHILLNKVLPEDINEGYHDFHKKVVMRVNGVKPTNMKHLIQLLKDNNGEYQEFVFSDSNRLVLDRKAADASHAEVLCKHSIPCDRSADMVD